METRLNNTLTVEFEKATIYQVARTKTKWRDAVLNERQHSPTTRAAAAAAAARSAVRTRCQRS